MATLEEKSKNILKLIEQKGLDAACKEGDQTIKDGLYYGYLTQEKLTSANHVYGASSPKTLHEIPDLPPMPQPSQKPEEKLVEKTKFIDLSSYAYRLTPQETGYALAIRTLQVDCLQNVKTAQPKHTYRYRTIYRPLTLEETMVACIEDFEREKDEQGNKRTLANRLRLFNADLGTSTGIAYTPEKGKFKIISLSHDIIELDPLAEVDYIHIDYKDLQGIEIDTSKSPVNKPLTLNEVLKHHGWLAAIKQNHLALKAYAQIAFTELKDFNIQRGMDFKIKTKPATSQLRPLYLDPLSIGKCCRGDLSLDIATSFIRLEQKKWS